MRYLYVYPHPDDESFGPAPAMYMQRRQGSDVYLLTLTRGGATRQRHRFGYSIEEMGEIRYKEMRRVAEVLDLSGLHILDFPDSALKNLDPRLLVEEICREIEALKPDVLVSYPIHGISGFHDHLVTHAVVKHAFLTSRERFGSPQRLAFHTLTEEEALDSGVFPLHGSSTEEIDCFIHVEDIDIQRTHMALDCYETFSVTIEKTGIKEKIQRIVPFEIFMETWDPPLTDLAEGLHGQ